MRCGRAGPVWRPTSERLWPAEGLLGGRRSSRAIDGVVDQLLPTMLRLAPEQAVTGCAVLADLAERRRVGVDRDGGHAGAVLDGMDVAGGPGVGRPRLEQPCLRPAGSGQPALPHA